MKKNTFALILILVICFSCNVEPIAEDAVVNATVTSTENETTNGSSTSTNTGTTTITTTTTDTDNTTSASIIGRWRMTSRSINGVFEIITPCMNEGYTEFTATTYADYVYYSFPNSDIEGNTVVSCDLDEITGTYTNSGNIYMFEENGSDDPAYEVEFLEITATTIKFKSIDIEEGVTKTYITTSKRI